MATAPRLYRRPGIATAQAEGRTPQQVEYRRWYRRRPWTGPHGLRARQLEREPLCRECLKAGTVTAASVVDHDRPHRGDWYLFIDESNHVSLCPHHHSMKTQRGE
jgi:5-methylcytosine-specific restriction protein A